MPAVLPADEFGSHDRAKILVVDDRRENLIALEAVLAPLNEEIVWAMSGEEALRKVLTEEFAVILMDAQMPDMDGFETAAFIRERERTKHLPIIFVTAYSRDRREVSHGYSVGAVDYITKPYDPDILRSKVRVFVELYKRGEQIKRQQELIRVAEAREAELLLEEQAREMEQQHMRELAEELEARVEERTAQLVAANEELQAFCYSVSHDLRTPLRAISSTSRILLEDAAEKLSEQELASLKRQESAAVRLGELIDDLLELSRLGRHELEKKEVDFTKLVKDAFEEVLSRDWENAPKLRVQKGLTINADPQMLRILLINLLENACKYSPKGGTICVGYEPINGHGAFFVRDEGIGFDMKYANKVFQPFERLHVDQEYPGTGIGLASVERIAKRHGGRVWVDSEEGKGSVFYFTVAERPSSVAVPALAQTANAL